ncbi:MAG: ABC transporter ATP-binding protein [Gemmatimonadota bacterium]|nr:ABC transporter ATP-binding protein [Gemmatimonadota bacterium]
MKPAIDLRGVSVLLLRKKPILQDITLRIEPGQSWGFAGPNGSGKSTLMRLITGFLPAATGEVEVLEKSIASWKPTQLRKKVGYLPQHLFFDEGIPISAREVILIGRTGKRGLMRRLTGEDYAKALSCAARLGITSLLDRPIGSLSGGERQLVQLARALAQEPDILILDEPTNNLDPRAAAGFLDTVDKLHKEMKLTVLTVTHEIPALPRGCSRLAFLKEGRLIASGPKESLLADGRMLSGLYGIEVSVEKKGRSYHIFRE